MMKEQLEKKDNQINSLINLIQKPQPDQIQETLFQKAASAKKFSISRALEDTKESSEKVIGKENQDEESDFDK